MQMTTRLIYVFLTIIGSACWGYSQILHSHPHDTADCIKESEWALKGVSIGDPSTRLDSLLGAADSVKQLIELDDGSEYTNYKHFYSGFIVDVVRNVVDRIVVFSPKVHLASGVAIGDAFERVVKALGRTPMNALDKQMALSFPTCPHRIDSDGVEYGLGGWLIMTFDDTKVLTNIELLVLRP